ncbi:ATP-binding protein [Pendulispora albinea]|uniref:histidine kinase n=1 Tax=Pendulispora albinea TaxID=2741071 RepID=A0ABZ2LSJ9_9BACT
MNEATPSPLASLLVTARDALLERWAQRLLHDPEVPSAQRLSRPALEDNFPVLIERIVQRLERMAANQDGGKPEHSQSEDVGVAHARHRFAAQYTIAEALRELRHFRGAVLDICDEHRSALTIGEARVLHATIDESMEIAASEIEGMAVRRFEHVMAIVAHDLRAPLQVITGHATLLKEGLALGASDCAIVGAALERSSKQMVRLIEDLGLASELELGHLSIQRRSVDARSIVQNVIEQLRYIANRKSITLATTMPEQPVLAVCDPERIEQALGNIVSNAIHFTPRAGQIRIDLKASLKQAMFRVLDSGPGIAPEHREHVFHPFWKGSSTRRTGMGLGLAIARGIVEAHGGTIFVTSPPGSGAVFCFTISLEADEAPSESIEIGSR